MGVTSKSPAHIKSISGVVGDALRYAPATLLPALIAVASSATFTRIFDPKSYGVWLLVNAIVGLLVSGVSQVFSQPIGRFYAEMTDAKDGAVYALVINRIMRWLLLGGFAIMVCATLLVLTLKEIRVSPWIIVGAALGAVALTMVASLSPILMATRDIRAFGKLQLVRAILSFIAPLSLIVLFGRHIVLMIWGSTITFWITALILRMWISKRLNPLNTTIDITTEILLKTKETVKRFLRYGIPMGFWFFFSTLIDSSDRYVIGAFDGTGAVALYGTAYTIVAQAFSLASSPLVNAMWPRIMHLWARERDPKSIQKFLRHVTDLYMMVGIALIGGTAVVGTDVVRMLLGPGYQGGSTVMVPIMIGSVLWGASMLGHKSIEIFERNDLMMWNVAVASVANIVFNVVLIPRFGWKIAGYTTLVSYTVYFCSTWVMSRRFIPWDLPLIRILVYGIAAVIGWYISIVFPVLGSHVPILDFAKRGILFCVCYVAIVLGYRITSTHLIKRT